MSDNLIKYAIESPFTEQVNSRSVTIRGWCFEMGADNLKGIRAWVGNRKFIAKRKRSRPQIGRMFPSISEAERSGFIVNVELPRGGGRVVLEARTSDGGWNTIETLHLKAPWICWPWQAKQGEFDLDQEYQIWLNRYGWIDKSERKRIRRRVKLMEDPPMISIIVPVYNTPGILLCSLIESVRNQLYPHWELCLADDHSPQKHVREVLEQAAASDPRIRIVYREENGNISAASNSAMKIATGKFIGLLDHDDELPEHALYWVAEEILAHPDVGIIFSDEDKITEDGRRQGPYFKPDYNYDLFLSRNCLSHLGVFRSELIHKVGGFRAGMEGGQDWDLALRIIEIINPTRIRHIPRILYHRRIFPGRTALHNDKNSFAEKAGLRAVREHLERVGCKEARVEHTNDFLRVCWPLPDPVPPVSLIMPTRNMFKLLQVAVETVLERTSYPNYELLIVDNDSEDEDTLRFLSKIAGDPRVRVISYQGEFNYSKINNFAVAMVDRPVICLLNNDIEVKEGAWLEEMVSQASRSGVGAVGALLLYPSGQIQHAGVVVGMVGGAGHPFRKEHLFDCDRGRRALLTQSYSAVTAACMVVERKLYDEVGGLDEDEFAIGLNDIDFCLKLRKAGYRNIFTPFAQLIHHESASRADMERTSAGANRAAGENAALAAKWPEYFDHDPCWNPNLSLLTEWGGLAFPPRNSGHATL